MTTNNTYTPYRDMEAKLENLEDFRGSSVVAVNVGDHYIIKSYLTTILDINLRTGEGIFDNRKYSRTTSKIQNMIITCAFLDKKYKARQIHYITK